MNDRYLFKAKHSLHSKKWYVGNIIKESDGIYIKDIENNSMVYVNDLCTICQCTGLKDKAGNLIWENDVVTNEERIGVVKFGGYSSSFFGNNAHFGFYIEWLKNEYLREDIMFWLSKLKSITNIFDNPELLEVE